MVGATVVVVAGAAPYDAAFIDSARRDLQPLAGRAEFVYLVGLPMEELLGELSRLPADAVILYVQVSRDSFIEVQPAGADRRPGISHLGLHVENIRATLARLAQHGVKVEEPRASRTNSVIANATGPDGIRMELSELGPESLQRKAMNSWK